MGRVRKVINDDDFWSAAAQNKWTMFRTLNQLSEIAVSMFEWENIPDTVDTRFLETILYREGKILFFRDEDADGFAVARVALSGQMGIYDTPTERNYYTTANKIRGRRSPADSVIIWNNFMREPSFPIMKSFAMDIYDIHRTAIINCKAMKTPLLVTCSRNQELTLKNLYMKYDGNEPAVFAKEGQLDADALKVINTQAPLVAPQMLAVEQALYAEALKYLGVQGAASEKRERLVSAEMSASQGSTFAMRYSRLAMRQEAAKQINAMFGLNVNVKFRAETLESFEIEEDVGAGGLETNE